LTGNRERSCPGQEGLVGDQLKKERYRRSPLAGKEKLVPFDRMGKRGNDVQALGNQITFPRKGKGSSSKLSHPRKGEEGTDSVRTEC